MQNQEMLNQKIQEAFKSGSTRDLMSFLDCDAGFYGAVPVGEKLIDDYYRVKLDVDNSFTRIIIAQKSKRNDNIRNAPK